MTTVPFTPRHTHCIHGHELTPENTHERPKRKNGRVYWERVCRKCRSLRVKLPAAALNEMFGRDGRLL